LRRRSGSRAYKIAILFHKFFEAGIFCRERIISEDGVVMPELRASDCSCSPTFSGGEEAAIYHHLYEANAPLAMGYVPFQHWEQPIERARALQYGTVFHELHKPFCGKGGRRV